MRRVLSLEIERMVGDDTSDRTTSESKISGIRRLITKRLNKIEYKAHGNIKPRVLYTFEKDLNGLDCAYGFISENLYFSNLSAIYFLELTVQRPLIHYICFERHYSPNSSFVYDEDLARIAFRKRARISKRYVQYKETQIHFIEKQNMDMMGVVSIPIKKKDKKGFFIKCTNLERTFIDSVVSPQYSGEIESVISFFKNTNLNLSALKKIYRKLNPIYPYWQNIGYLLDVMNQEEKSEEWRGYFKNIAPEKFFISKGYRSNWYFNKKWKIYHPESMS